MTKTQKTKTSKSMSSWQPTSWSECSHYIDFLPNAHTAAQDAAKDRQDNLLKPAGSLGRLEDIAIWLAAWQGESGPKAHAVDVHIFAGNHGICKHGVSAYPATVTEQMVGAFEAGVAAVNQMATATGAQVTVHPLNDLKATKDNTSRDAMTEQEAFETFVYGMQSVAKSNTAKASPDLVILGEMGIGNTAVSSCLYAACLGGDPAAWVGRGTGLNTLGMVAKVNAVAKALKHHGDIIDQKAYFEILRCLGGYEFVAMCGAMVQARLDRTPILLDGFNVTAAAAVLFSHDPDSISHMMAGHISAENAHAKALDIMSLSPLLALNMRLGEGTGALAALPLVQMAAQCHTGMATFSDLGIPSA